MEFFHSEKLTDHVTRISGIIAEYMYLVQGTERALLIDTGCGAGNIRIYAESLTHLPLTVVLTHGHYDHAGGSGWFDEIWVSPLELIPTAIHYNRFLTYEKLHAGHTDLSLNHMAPEMDPHHCMIHPLTPGHRFSLGGITVEAIPCPGHTPDTYCMLIEEERLLLTGDACHSITYLFFDSALSVEEYQASLRKLKSQENRWDSLLLSHPVGAAPKIMIDEVLYLCGEILRGTTDEIPFSYEGKPTFIARAVDDRMLRTDGIYGNIIFRKDKLYSGTHGSSV